MKPNKYIPPKTEVINIDSHNVFCDFIPTSQTPGPADVKEQKMQNDNTWEVEW